LVLAIQHSYKKGAEAPRHQFWNVVGA
jgi:hypothetical protein